jgi:hypothetical protein
MKKLFWLCISLPGLLLFAHAGGRSKQAEGVQLKEPIAWFQRANDQLNLRTPGAAPFRLTVSFHAYPGMELLGKKKKSQMTVGDGVYEETWLGPHTWRREVRLADYHAIEEESNDGRKMQASSDYEPSRVLMLLEALLDPIPRDFVSREYTQSVIGWRIDTIQDQKTSLVRIGRGDSNPRVSITDAFFFLPAGLLVLRNNRGLITSWGDDALFEGRVVPKTLTVMAGDRTLVSAHVTIEAAGKGDPKTFNLPGEEAEAGETLRPLHQFEVRMPEMMFERSSVIPGGTAPSHGNSIWGVLDRHGQYRDVELIDVADAADGKADMEIMREDRHSPPKIDGKPCEVAVSWGLY